MEKRMKTFNRILSLAFAILLLAACTPQVTQAPATESPATQPVLLQFDNPYASQPGDNDLMGGEIDIDSASVSLAESQPPQVIVNLAYFPPTPCYQLRVLVSGPNDQNQINLKAYGVAPKNKPCNLMALATPLQASLNLGSLPKGHYTVLLNDNQIGEFNS
jgi:hypothetical protein